QLPHVLSEETPEVVDRATIEKHLEQQRRYLGTSADCVAEVHALLKADAAPAEMTATARKIPPKLANYVLHTLISRLGKKKKDKPSWGSMVEVIQVTGQPLSEFMPQMQALGMGDESDEAFTHSCGLLTNLVRNIDSKIPNGVDSHGLLDGPHEIPTNYFIAQYSHPGVAVVADDIIGILKDADRFRDALKKQRSLDPVEDKDAFETHGREASAAYARCSQRSVPMMVL